ncbi:MAG: CRISPR-associated protein Cas4 [Nanoarchaeota archaeon]
MKISVSMLATYMFCPRKLFLEQVLALKEPPKESTALGSLRHNVYNSINQSEERIVASIAEKIQYSQLISSYKAFYSNILREQIIKNKPSLRQFNLDLAEVFKKTWPLMLNEAESRSNNVFSFIQQHNVYGKELWERLTPKILSEHKIESELLQLKGIIDRIEVYDEGYIPIELKTGKMPKEGVWPGHRIQIVAYAMLVEEKYSTKVKEGFVRYLDSNESRQIAINPFMKEEIRQITSEIQEMLKSADLPYYCSNRNKCVNCGLRSTCYDEEKVTTMLSEMQ